MICARVVSSPTRVARHLRKRRFVGRDALAGERRLVDRARAVEHHTVDRDALPRPHEKHVAQAHLLDRHGQLRAAALHGRGLGRELQEAAQRVGRLALGARLERLADGNEREDHGGGLKVKIMHIAHDGLRIAAHLRARHGKERIRAVDKRRRRAERHERVHVRHAVPERLVAADEKLLVDDHDDHRQQQLCQAHGNMVTVIKARQRPAPHHVPHGKIHQDEQKAQRPAEPAPQSRRLVVGERVAVGRGGRLPALNGRAVARSLHRVDDRLIRRRALHAHGVRQQADRACRHARHVRHRLFHARRAGGTTHTGDIKLFQDRPSFGNAHFMSFCSVATSSSITSSLPPRMSSTTQVRM